MRHISGQVNCLQQWVSMGQLQAMLLIVAYCVL